MTKYTFRVDLSLQILDSSDFIYTLDEIKKAFVLDVEGNLNEVIDNVHNSFTEFIEKEFPY